MNNNLAIEKGLIHDGDKSLYMNVENIYKYFFELYLQNKVDLKKYDDEIKNSNLDFGKPNPTSEQLICDTKEFLNLDYLYILNHFFVEKLSREDLNILIECIEKKTFSFTEEIKELINRTYKNIIRNNFHKGNYVDSKYKVCYGYAIPNNFVDNDALVLKIFYSRNTKEMSNEAFLKNLVDKKEFLNKLSEDLKMEISAKLELNCSILIEKIPN